MGVRGFRSGAVAAALAIVVALTTATPAVAASGVDYPSWDEVEAARGNEAATAATIAQIDQLLAGLQAEAARLGDAAVARSAEADAATAALEQASARANSLAAQAEAAAARATQSTAQASQIAAALYRSGGTDVTGTLLLVSDQDSAELLNRLGALDKVGSQLDIVLDRAAFDRNQATSLSEQAGVAETERERLSAAAQQALAAAQEAVAAADAAVATQQANLTLLYEQLAALKNTTALVEQQYAIGQQALNDAANAGGAGGSTDVGSDFVVPGNEVNDVAAARQYAFNLLVSWGNGQDQLNCLLWLWNRESGWRTNAYNPNGGAYGIPQSLPGSKMALAGADWRTNYRTQINWGLAYISAAYGTPCGAWAHSEQYNWY